MRKYTRFEEMFERIVALAFEAASEQALEQGPTRMCPAGSVVEEFAVGDRSKVAVRMRAHITKCVFCMTVAGALRAFRHHG